MLLMTVFFFASGCLRQQPVPVRLEGPGDLSDFQPVGTSLACRLLSKEEVELALNAAAGVPLEQGRPILPGMSMCSLNTSTGSVASWGVLSKSAQSQFQSYVQASRQYLNPMTMAGKDGVWDQQLATFVVLKGTRAIGVRLTVTRPPLSKGLDRKTYLEQTARLLTLRALRRL